MFKQSISSKILIASAISFFATACQEPTATETKVAAVSASHTEGGVSTPPTPEFNAYWFAGKAEVNSYELQIDRYGEPRKGYAVMVFVTEDFSNQKHVKLDYPEKAGDDRVPVLKLNALQRFNTGIYDYSMMTSLFTPLDYGKKPHTLKWNTTVQDWCGHVFTQLDHTNGNTYKVQQNSYFEMEGDKAFTTEGVLLEDEIFTRLRLNPESLPKNKVKIIPNLTYSRIRHKPVEAVEATISFKDGADGQTTCSVIYTSKRRLDIVFEKAFPHKILAYTELDGDKQLSRATLIKNMQSDYWMKNGNASAYLREMLGI
jgi:hypothetical protein